MVEQKFRVLVIHCTLCKFSQEIDMEQLGSIKVQKAFFMEQHKGKKFKGKQCKGKQ